jgi:hypothetical protein
MSRAIRLWIASTLVAAAAWAEAPAPEAEAPLARVTAVAGSATAGDQALAQHAALAGDQKVATAADGNAALLLEDDALLELCGDTAVRLARMGAGRQVIYVDGGEARISVQPRAPGESLEIHTPVAIATILGTVIHVKVDPRTGETTFTSEDSNASIRSAEPGVAGKTVIGGGEATTIAAGGGPQEKKLLPKRALANLSTCLRDLHEVSVENARAANEAKVTEQVAAVDMDAADLPAVAAAEEVPEPEGEEAGDETDLITPVDANDLPEPAPEELPSCPFLPCDHGGF